ncbi:MAG TPA: UbiA family prenyltransferase [Gemmatimonadaceae bacterium]|nr:UbiA family prenyltransferase [Gemmatimonadaceae bacterium]
MRSCSAFAALARWPNALLAATGVAVGAWWAHGSFGASVLWAAGAAVAITAAANAWNDAADLAIDRAAHPERPLPRGILAPRDARWFAWGSALAAVPASYAAAPPLGALTVGVLAIARGYSPHIKRTGLAGNVVVAVVASLPFLYGAWAVGRPAAGALLVAIAAPLHLAREIAKDLDDASADAGRRLTIPIRYGPRLARGAVTIAAALFLVALGPPAAGAPAFALALVPAAVLSVAGAGAALRGRRGSPRLFKAAMVCAMLAVLIARP